MRGFMDLLFRFEGRYYLVDWKSNWLGNRPAHYGEQGVRAAMLRHAYFLQYQLYTVAADLFLRQRLPGYQYKKDFGGIFYVFVRGIDPENRRVGFSTTGPKLASSQNSGICSSGGGHE